MKIKIKGTSLTIQNSLSLICNMKITEFNELDEIEIEEIFEEDLSKDIPHKKHYFPNNTPIFGIGEITC